MWRLFIVGIFLIGTLTSNGQVAPSTEKKEVSKFDASLLMPNSQVLAKLNLVKTPAPTLQLTSVMVKQPSLLPTAFFCKLEHKFDKNSKVPMKFRLGDIDYTDAIEGKNRYDVSTFTAEQRKQN